jgi:hypothetical protein
MALTLGELEQQLRSVSHSEEAIQAVEVFSNGLSGRKERLAVWNAANAIVRKPIEFSEWGSCLSAVVSIFSGGERSESASGRAISCDVAGVPCVVWRGNRRHSRHRGLLFYRLLENAVATMPTPFRHPRATP